MSGMEVGRCLKATVRYRHECRNNSPLPFTALLSGSFASALATACLIRLALEVLGEDSPVGADQERRGREPHAEGRLERVRVVRAADVPLLPAQAVAGGIAAHGPGRLVRDQPDHDEARVAAEGVVGRLEVGDDGRVLGPTRPEMQEHELAAQGGQVERAAVGRLAAIVGARSPTFGSWNGKTSSGMAPMSSGSSLRPPGISGTTTSAWANACRPSRVPRDSPSNGSFRTYRPAGTSSIAERAVGAEVDGVGPIAVLDVGAALGRSGEGFPPGRALLAVEARGSQAGVGGSATTGASRTPSGRAAKWLSLTPSGIASRPTTGRPVPPSWTRTVSPGFTSRLHRVGEGPALLVRVLDAAIDRSVRPGATRSRTNRPDSSAWVSSLIRACRATSGATRPPSRAGGRLVADLHEPLDPAPGREGEIGGGGQVVGPTAARIPESWTAMTETRCPCGRNA